MKRLGERASFGYVVALLNFSIAEAVGVQLCLHLITCTLTTLLQDMLVLTETHTHMCVKVSKYVCLRVSIRCQRNYQQQQFVRI